MPTANYISISHELCGFVGAIIGNGNLWTDGSRYRVELTGDLLWTYNMTQPYTELMWDGANWPIEIAFISDGKVYLLHSEHSGNTPCLAVQHSSASTPQPEM